MLKRIERATIRLLESEQSEAFSSEEPIDDIRFSDKVLGDVKRMVAVLLFTIIRFYQLQPHTEYDEEINAASKIVFDSLKDKLILKITRIFLAKNVYKICLAICRHDTLTQEKKLRVQLKRLGNGQVTP